LKNLPLQVRGARENNLQNLDIDLPRGGIIVLTGPSGSGKSSLAIDTLHAEGQRRLIEALGAGRSYRLRRPAVSLITGLPPTVGVLQHATRSSRSTVGTLTETGPLLRTLAAHDGVCHCPVCDKPLPALPAEHITARLAALPQGTRLTLLAPVRQRDLAPARILDEIHLQGFARVRIDGELCRLDEAPALTGDTRPTIEVVIDRIKVTPDKRARIFEAVQTALAAGDGRLMALTTPDAPLLQMADHPYCFDHDCTLPRLTPRRLSAGSAEGTCETCSGSGCDTCDSTGLSDTALGVRLGGRPLRDWLVSPLSDVQAWLTALETQAGAAALRAELSRRLDVLLGLKLGHLPLSRRAPALSTGEHGRARLAGQTGHALSGVMFVIDEPSAGLHPAELPALSVYLRSLRDAGNTVLVVDHHPAILAAADHHLRFGPGAGPAGGRLLYSGPPEPVKADAMPTTTGKTPSRSVIKLVGARGKNLRGLTFVAPKGKWTAVSGVSGSGKTALISETLAPAVAQHLGQKGSPLPFDKLTGVSKLRRLLQLDRAPLGRSWRSCTATAVGVWTSVRNLLSSTRASKIRGFGPERFSFNRAGGRCEACLGAGRRRLDLDYLPDAVVTCEVCEGRRFDGATLSVEYRGASVHDILQMSINEARQHFANQPRILRTLTALSDVGLGYLPLGQTADTFSGGEAQRVRLAGELARSGPSTALGDTLVVLDEPAAALHPDDVGPIRDALRRLVSRGATLVTVASAPALLRAADHLVILGPGAGPDGGDIVEQGAPTQAG